MPKKSPKKTTEARFKCQHCELATTSKGILTRHIKTVHSGKQSKIGSKPDIKGAHGLSPQEETFCRIYATEREFFGNGVQSYIEAFEVTVGKGEGCQTYEYCKYRAHSLLVRATILKRINEIYEAGGLNDAHVDKQLELLITQNAEFNPKVRAIQEYNKLKKRTVETVQHMHAFADIKGMTDKELAKEKEALLGFFQKK